ncbi:unnamed protein product, partial [Symbiodinium sp. KB8]
MLPATLWLCLVCAGLDFAAAVAPSLRSPDEALFDRTVAGLTAEIAQCSRVDDFVKVSVLQRHLRGMQRPTAHGAWWK